MGANNKCECCGKPATTTVKGVPLCADCAVRARMMILDKVFNMDIFEGI